MQESSIRISVERSDGSREVCTLLFDEIAVLMQELHP